MDAGLFQELVDTSQLYFEEQSDPNKREAMLKVLKDAIEHCNLEFGKREAQGWAAGFEWDPQALAADMASFEEAGGDLPAMALMRQETMRPDRLNKERVNSLREDNPERGLLLQLCEGMKVHKPEGFIPNGQTSAGTQHESYIGSYPAVDKMLSANHEQGLGFVLPASVMTEIPHQLMVSKWTTKKNTASGRNIGDMSCGEGVQLNGEEAKAKAMAMYAAIRHPTIDEIVMAILDYWEKAQKEYPGVQWKGCSAQYLCLVRRSKDGSSYVARDASTSSSG